VNWGLTNLGSIIDNFELKLNYSDWTHADVEHFVDGDSETATTFDNQQFVYRGVFEQGRKGDGRAGCGSDAGCDSSKTRGKALKSPR